MSGDHTRNLQPSCFRKGVKHASNKLKIIASCTSGNSSTTLILFPVGIANVYIEIKTAVVEGATGNEAMCKILRTCLDEKLTSSQRRRA